MIKYLQWYMKVSIYLKFWKEYTILKEYLMVKKHITSQKWTKDVSNLGGWRESNDDDAHVVPAALVEASVDHLVADGLQVVVHLHHGELENLVLNRNFHIIHFPSGHFVNFFLHSPSYLARIEIMTILSPPCDRRSMDIYDICIWCLKTCEVFIENIEVVALIMWPINIYDSKIYRL